MNPSTVKNTLRFLPYWSLEGGLASFDIEYAKCTVTVTGNLLSFQQAREFFPILQKAIAESSFDEPIAVRGFVREIRKLASYRISITEGSDTLDFPLIERICLYGSNPKATIRLEPVFFSLLTEAGMFFDESIVDSVKSRISWVFSRLAKLYGNSETSVDLELLEKLVSADQFDAKRWLTENNVAVQGKKVCLNILSA